MTLQEAKSIARHLGLTLRKMRSGDYRVNFRDGKETTAYYTPSLEDAIRTAVEMARKRRGYGPDSAKSISAAAIVRSPRCADRYDGRPHRCRRLRTTRVSS